MTGSGSIYDGGRALHAALRPYPAKVAGEPLRMVFDLHTRVFEFSFRHQAGIVAPTEIFIPDYQYPQGFQVMVSDGSTEQDGSRQTLIYRHTQTQPVHTIQIKPALKK